MNKLLKILFLLITTFVYSQKRVEYYNYGYDGMESVSRVRGTDSMLIYSNYKSRPLIRKEVCDSILKHYKKIKNGPYTLNIKDAKVIGRLLIEKRHNLVSVTFFYESVEYANGLIEVYKPPIKKLKRGS
jgi:hypothetical protein